MSAKTSKGFLNDIRIFNHSLWNADSSNPHSFNTDELINHSPRTVSNYPVDVSQASGNINDELALSPNEPSNLLPTQVNVAPLIDHIAFPDLLVSTNTTNSYAAINLNSLTGDDHVAQSSGNTKYLLELAATAAPLPKPDLVARFSTIELPDTVDFGDDGKARITVTNQGNAVAQGPITVNLYISTDGNINYNSAGELVNDGLLTSVVKTINLQPGESTTFELEYDNLTSVVAPGAYNLIAEVDPQNTITESTENNNIVSQNVSAPGTDAVIDWNAIALNAIQAEGESDRGVPPTAGTRVLAIVSAAVYDTVNAFDQIYTPYAVDALAPWGASVEAAVVGAAHRALVELLPNQAPLFDQQLVRSLIEITDNPAAEVAGVAFGRSVADKILALRENDGSDNNAPYVPPAGDYIWQPDPGSVALGPNWGSVTPFAISSVEDFAPDGLDGRPDVDPELYTQEIEEVRLFGGKQDTELTTIVRSADQTEIAIFWAYDRIDSFRPYGQLNQIAEEVAVREGNTLADNARLLAALNIALADSAIVAWDAKYDELQPRPDDVIAGGFAANDGIEATVGDPDWQPLLPTPPFPDYISGHSTFGGAFAAVMTSFFGDNYEFTAVSQELIHTTRTYGSFYEAAYEDAISRVYGGIHVREATVTDALPTGLDIGNFVAQNLFQPVV